MKRRDATLTLAAAGLASTTPAAWAQGGPVEGRHYQRLAQLLPGAPGKVEVIEFFFYKCPHCFAFDPLLGDWLHRLPPDVTFRRIPVGQQAMLKLHARIKRAAMAEGLMVYPAGGSVDGRCGDHILLAPPFISTPDELAQIVHRLRSAIDKTLAGVSKPAAV